MRSDGQNYWNKIIRLPGIRPGRAIGRNRHDYVLTRSLAARIVPFSIGAPLREAHRSTSCRRVQFNLEKLEDRRLLTVATGPASMIQSTFGTPGHLGHFEAVVQEGTDLVQVARPFLYSR